MHVFCIGLETQRFQIHVQITVKGPDGNFEGFDHRSGSDIPDG